MLRAEQWNGSDTVARSRRIDRVSLAVLTITVRSTTPRRSDGSNVTSTGTVSPGATDRAAILAVVQLHEGITSSIVSGTAPSLRSANVCETVAHGGISPKSYAASSAVSSEAVPCCGGATCGAI